jgi:hypothetical protein
MASPGGVKTMTRETVYARFTELTPEVIDRLTQKCFIEVNGTNEATADAICNEAIPTGWTRRIIRMLIKSADAAEVDLKLYSGAVAGGATPHLATLEDNFKVANLSVLPLESEDSRESLYNRLQATTHDQYYAIVDLSSAYVTTWYYDWPW